MNIIFKIPFIKHKAFEFAISDPFINSIRFGFEMFLDKKTDHAGIHFNMSLFKLFIELNFYDTRHWNYEKNRWFLPEELEE